LSWDVSRDIQKIESDAWIRDSKDRVYLKATVGNRGIIISIPRDLLEIIGESNTYKLLELRSQDLNSNGSLSLRPKKQNNILDIEAIESFHKE